MCALELVSDQNNKTPADKNVGLELLEATYREGVMIRASGPNVILSPSLILTKKDTDQILKALDVGFSAVTSMTVVSQ